MIKERRGAPRYRIDAEIAVGEGTGRTIDLSSNSVYFEAVGHFAPGEQLELVFPFEHGSRGASVRCLARVVRVDPRGECFGIAATYEPVDFIPQP